MLNVAFLELMPRVQQNLRACQFGFGVNQRHHILQLIAEAERPAGLIERRTRPDSAHQRLIQKPAIRNRIKRSIGRFDFDGRQNFVPKPADFFKRIFDVGDLAKND